MQDFNIVVFPSFTTEMQIRPSTGVPGFSDEFYKVILIEVENDGQLLGGESSN